jgi:hypothetical protein
VSDREVIGVGGMGYGLVRRREFRRDSGTRFDREPHASHQSTIVDSALSSALSPQNECLVEIASAFLTRQMGLIAP